MRSVISSFSQTFKPWTNRIIKATQEQKVAHHLKEQWADVALQRARYGQSCELTLSCGGSAGVRRTQSHLKEDKAVVQQVFSEIQRREHDSDYNVMWMSFFLVSMRTFLTIRRMSAALFVSRRRPCPLGQRLPESLRCTGTMWSICMQLCRDNVNKWQVKSHKK